jgi:hypothetical protein
MNDFDRRQYEMLVRVRDFGATHGHLFPASSPAQQAFGEVGAGLREIEAQDVAETSASFSARATRKLEARRALVERLMLLARTAQVLPGVDSDVRATFQVPDSTNAQLLLTAARRFAKHATAYAEQFIAHGIPATFLADLAALVEQLEAALRDRGVGRDQQMASRARIKKALANGVAATRKLDVIVSNHLASDSAVRGVWKRNRRIEYANRSRKVAAKSRSDAPEAPTAPAVPVVSPVGVPPIPTGGAGGHHAEIP